MNKIRARSLGCLAAGLLCSCFAQAQQSVNAAGGDASGSGGTVAYSVGQAVYSTNTDASGTVSQGVQQAYEIYTIGFQENILDISLSVFPNPTPDILNLEIPHYQNEQLSYQLFDIKSKLLINKQVESKVSTIDMRQYPKATYLLYIYNQNHKRVQSFEILKH